MTPTGLLPAALAVFLAACFVMPSGPAYALVFYAGVLPLACLAALRLRWRQPGVMLAAALIAWSGLTLLWGHDDGHRSWRFALDSAMTLGFLAALLAGSRDAAARHRLATVLIWAGAANAMLSIALGILLPLPTERLHGWGATSHPILGASVMATAYLAALCRVLQERPRRLPHAAAALAMASFIALTESRGPLLAAGAATLFLCAAGPWRWRALGLLAALAAVWRLLPASMRQHQEAVLANRGSSHRFEIWHRTLQLIGQRPLFGHGLAANLDLPGITFPHDLYLSVLFYSGAVGMALFAGLLAACACILWRQRRDAAWLWPATLWVNVLLAGLTDLGQITKGPGPLWLIFWLPVGLVLAGAQQPGPLLREPGGGLRPVRR